MSARTFIYIGWIIIAAPAAAQVVVFEDNFDGLDAPVGWTLDDGWMLSTSTPSSGSGLNSLQHKGNAATSAYTPKISLSGAVSATLTYLVRRTGAYGTDNLVVRGSADGGQSFAVTLLGAGLAVPASDSNWETITIAIPPELLGSTQVVLQFAGQGLYAASATARIDDVTIAADVPLEVAPLSLSFTAVRGASDTRSITALNRTSEALSISAPVVAGAEFSIDPSGSVVVGPGAVQVYEITFTADAQGFVGGSVHLDYGSGAADVTLSGMGNGGMLTFGEPSSAAVEDETGVAVPLRLAFASSERLQGLQFRLLWSGTGLAVSGVEPGTAISSTNEWSLSHETRSGYVDVVLLGEGTTSLSSGTYEDLLSVIFDVGSGASPTASLTLQNVIGALAEPDGSDADISASSEAHLITIGTKSIFFQASPSALDLGVTAVGESVTATLTVSNPGGSSDLVVDEITTSNPLFSITPAAGQIAPDDQLEFTITFTPTTTEFGLQNADMMFVHNGEGGTDVIPLSGTGVGGRGDVEGDGIVDVLDVIYAIDFVLDRLTPDPVEKAAADLFPFPAGDGNLDVRDLTVLSQAIVRGLWPDDVEIPIEVADAGKSQSGGIRLSVGESSIEMIHDMPIRAFQIVLPARKGAAVDMSASSVGTTPSGGAGSPAGDEGSRVGSANLSEDGAGGDEYGTGAGTTIAFGVRANPLPSVQPVGDSPTPPEAEHELRVIVYRVDGAIIPPGVLNVATHGVTGRPRYVTVIGERRERLRVDESVWTSTQDEPPSTVQPGKPYPNPLRAGIDMLHIRAGTPSAEVTVYDVLGRIVRRLEGSGELLEWDGVDASGRTVGSGTYFVRVVGARGVQAYPIQVVR